MFINDKWENNGYYTVIDTDFEASILIPFHMSKWEAIITIYEHEKLEVAPNLILAMKRYCNNEIMEVNYLIDAIKSNTRDNPNFAKYEKDLEKYLILI